jgi:hypothetical protein
MVTKVDGSNEKLLTAGLGTATHPDWGQELGNP